MKSGDQPLQIANVCIFSALPLPSLFATPCQPSSGTGLLSPLSIGKLLATSSASLSPVMRTPPPVTREPCRQRAAAATCDPSGRCCFGVLTTL